MKRSAQGFTLIELVVVIALLALLTMAAVPAVGSWIANARVRSTAEALQNSLRVAQQEALRRNRRTVFALTAASPDWNAVPDANAANWYVRVQPLRGSPEMASRELSLVSSHQTGSKSGILLSGPPLLCFNAMGQLISVPAADTGLGKACDTSNPVAYTVSHASAERRLMVLVYLGGRVRMCDAAKKEATTPDGCPE
jgi:type IV fimbrial biogenesis protein FimT